MSICDRAKCPFQSVLSLPIARRKRWYKWMIFHSRHEAAAMKDSNAKFDGDALVDIVWRREPLSTFGI